MYMCTLTRDSNSLFGLPKARYTRTTVRTARSEEGQDGCRFSSPFWRPGPSNGRRQWPLPVSKEYICSSGA